MFKSQTHLHDPTAFSRKLDRSMIEWVEVSVTVVAIIGLSVGFFLSLLFAPTLDDANHTAAADTSLSQSQFWLLHDGAMLEQAVSEDGNTVAPTRVASAPND
jgi:hypothetical protein